jgi:pimeloyl-ACP methyl ester carboxylesterase
VSRGRNLALYGLLFALGFCAVAVACEHVLEARDAARFTAGDTFYTVHERRIRYHLTGQHDPGPTVVLLNGLTASLEQWEGVQTSLSKTSPVLSYDRGGAGFSDPAVANDANADADELDQLLQSHEIPRPFVLVGYSSSVMMAIVFAAKHPDIVKGVVFIDPVVRSQLPGSKTFRHIFWRFNLIALESFTGYTRLRVALAGVQPLPSAQGSQSYNAILSSAHHWVASTHDAMSLDESCDEQDAALATHPFAHLPVGLLSTLDPPSSTSSGDVLQAAVFRDVYQRQMSLVTTSDEGVLREFHGVHNQLLNDASATGYVVDLVRTVVAKVRARAGADGTRMTP